MRHTVWGETNKRNFLVDPPRYDSAYPLALCVHICTRECVEEVIHALAYMYLTPR